MGKLSIKPTIICINLIVFLGFLNWGVIQQEAELVESRSILLAVNPVFPNAADGRAFLRFAIAEVIQMAGANPMGGYAVLKVDPDGIAYFDRLVDSQTTSIRRNEVRIRYESHRGRVLLGIENDESLELGDERTIRFARVFVGSDGRPTIEKLVE